MDKFGDYQIVESVEAAVTAVRTKQCLISIVPVAYHTMSLVVTRIPTRKSLHKNYKGLPSLRERHSIRVGVSEYYIYEVALRPEEVLAILNRSS